MKGLASWDTVDFSSSSDADIKQSLQKLNIPLSVDEAKKIQFSFLKRPATLTELVLFSIQGSEHSSYKSSKNHIKHFITDGKHVILGAKDDAGVVSLSTDNDGEKYGLVVSHESHNHPSQIVPYEGAATGVGGNVRDVCCMGAEVMSLGDSLRFGDINRNKTKWISDGVVSGIAGYGNPLGIPNICGDVYFDKDYNENCLVTVLTAGVVKEKNVIRSRAPKNSEGYDLILVGKLTDNSGFGGASFASLELEEEKEQQNKGAVQGPNAFLERHILKSTYALFDFLEENDLINKVGFNLEFGVYSGRTINCLSSLRPDLSFIGFDSFEGLPSDWDMGGKLVKKEYFKKKEMPIVNQNVTLIKGFFDKTINEWISNLNKEQLKNNKKFISYLHSDIELLSLMEDE